MPAYTVTFTRTLELKGQFTIRARTLNAAAEQADDLIRKQIMTRPLMWLIMTGKPVVTWEEVSDIDDDLEVHPV